MVSNEYLSLLIEYCYLSDKPESSQLVFGDFIGLWTLLKLFHNEFQACSRKIRNFDPVILDFIVTADITTPRFRGGAVLFRAQTGPNSKWNLNYEKYTNLLFLTKSLKPAVPYFAAFLFARTLPLIIDLVGSLPPTFKDIL